MKPLDCFTPEQKQLLEAISELKKNNKQRHKETLESIQAHNAGNRQVMTAFHQDRKKDHEILRCDNKTTHDRLAAQSHQLAAQSHQLAEMKDQMEKLVVACTPNSKHKACASSKLLGAVVVDDSSSAASSRLSSMVSATEDNRNLAELKKMEAENKKLHHDMKSLEMENKHLVQTLRVKNETPSMKKLRAKPRQQPLSENMENSINIHVGNNISGRASRSSARTPLGDANQDTSNPGLRRSARRAALN